MIAPTGHQTQVPFSLSEVVEKSRNRALTYSANRGWTAQE
jgi:hypothetical protein